MTTTPALDDDPAPQLPARAVELLQLVAAGAVLVQQKPHYSAVEITFALRGPTALWPEPEWLSLSRYLFSAGRNGLVTLTWGWTRDGGGCTVGLTELGLKHIAGHPPLMIFQPETGEGGWRANPTTVLEPWQLCEGNIVHAHGGGDSPGLRMQIGGIKYRPGSITVFSARTSDHLELAAGAKVVVETATLSTAQAAAVRRVAQASA